MLSQLVIKLIVIMIVTIIDLDLETYKCRLHNINDSYVNNNKTNTLAGSMLSRYTFVYWFKGFGETFVPDKWVSRRRTHLSVAKVDSL